MYIKKFRENGTIHIPGELRKQLPSNEVEVRLVECEVETGVVKQCVLLVPIGQNKEVVTYYK